MDDQTVHAFLGQLSERHRAAEVASESAYRLGRLDRATRRHNPPSRSGDAAVYDSADLMHRRARDMYLNQPLFKRCVDVLRDLIVGAGIHTFADPIDHTFGWDLKGRPDADLLRAFDYALEADERFLVWASDPAQCDVEQKLTLWDMQALAISDAATTGDVLIVETMRRGGDSPVPYQLQVIEREQLDMTKDGPSRDGTTRTIGGFVFDRRGVELGAWVHDVHPHDYWSSTTSSTFVPASRYHHIYKRTRPSQHLGATWMHAMGQPSIDRGKFLESELRTAVKSSLMLLAAYLENPSAGGLGLGDLDSDDDASTDLALGTSPIAAELRPGEDIKMIESNRPTDSANNFFDLLDHDLAAASNLSYYSMTGRFEKTNYGGFRGAMNLEKSQLDTIQTWLGYQVVLPIRRKWNRLAIARGVIHSVTAREVAAESARFDRYDAIGPGRHLLDPENETSGALAQLRGGLTTLKIECARRGLHWIRVLRQIHLENRITEVLGIALDHGSGGGGGSDSNTRTAEQIAEETAQ